MTDLEFFIILLTLFLTAVNTFFNVKSYRFIEESRKIKFHISSELRKENNSVIANIELVNSGQRRFVVQSIRLNLRVFDNSPKLKLYGLRNFLRIVREFSRPEYYYITDDIIQYSSTEKVLEEGSQIYATIDLNKMMESYIAIPYDGIKTKFEFKLMMRDLRIEILLTNGNYYSFKPDNDITTYIKRKYENDVRLYKS